MENQTNETIEKKFRACLVSINDSSVERESSEEAWGSDELLSWTICPKYLFEKLG